MDLVELIVIRLFGGRLRVGLKSITTKTEILATIHAFILLKEGLDAGFTVITDAAGAARIKMKFEPIK